MTMSDTPGAPEPRPFEVAMFAQGTIQYPAAMGLPPQPIVLRTSITTIQASGLVEPPPRGLEPPAP